MSLAMLPQSLKNGSPWIEKDEAGGVGRSARIGEQVGEEGAFELIRIEDVQTPVRDEGRDPGHLIEDALHARAQPSCMGPVTFMSRALPTPA